MAYSALKEEARIEDRLIRSFGIEAHHEVDLDTELGFIWIELDDDGEVATHDELIAALAYWNERL